MVEKMEVRVPLVKTIDNYADFFTKALKSRSQFFSMRDAIMNISDGTEPSSGHA